MISGNHANAVDMFRAAGINIDIKPTTQTMEETKQHTA